MIVSLERFTESVFLLCTELACKQTSVEVDDGLLSVSGRQTVHRSQRIDLPTVARHSDNANARSLQHTPLQHTPAGPDLQNILRFIVSLS